MVRRIEELAPLSGILAVALLIIGFALAGVFAYRPTAGVAVEIFSADPGRRQLGVLLGGFWAPFFLLVFVGYLYGAIRDKGGSAALAGVSLTGGVVLVVALAVGFRYLSGAAATVTIGGGIGPELAAALYQLYETSLAGFASLGLAALLGAAGLASLRSGLLPEPVGWSGVVSAVFLLTPLHWLFEILALGWIIAVSILLYRRKPA